MPKYYDFMICGYYLYFTSHCIVEAMHVHASDRRLTESGSAKLFVMGNGDTIVKEQGVLTNKELRIIREFVKDNYQEMFLKWSEMSNNGFYRGELFNKGVSFLLLIGHSGYTFFLLIYRGYYISSNDKQPRRISSFFNSGYTWSI